MRRKMYIYFFNIKTFSLNDALCTSVFIISKDLMIREREKLWKLPCPSLRQSRNLTGKPEGNYVTPKSVY
jgi:hypothetical protein